MSIKDKLNLISKPEDVFETGRDLLVNGHEVVDKLSEYSPYLKVASKWINKRRENKCKKFLQGLGVKVLSREELTFDDLKKLDELLKKNVNSFLVLDILEEATKTSSDNASKMLGIIAGQVMQEEREFDYNDWLLVNGLKNMNDWDLENLKQVYLYFDSYPQEEYVNSACVYFDLPLCECNDTDIDNFDYILESEDFKMFETSLMRINSLQILSTGPTISNVKNPVCFLSNKVGDEIYDLLNFINN
ncbi:hypothetical protein [Bacillus cereus]|uniref:Uncharacterized protein n=1 Tax=Bacillus cereus TaxID=1396 RepID=A0A2B1KLZ9_BACCE|nr:hypothetical protein [Bacillus cereus]PEX91820.1 hypothetical protein CN450_08785 [Bacillus cereus]PFN27121.1 hypothetical protein COJ50_09250 [Bacillus cereus]